MDKYINTLYLSYDGMTDPLGQSQVLPYIQGLSKKGYSFTLISFEKPDRFSQNKELIQKICDEHRITWKPLIYTKFPPVLSTLKDLWKMKRLVLQLHQKEKFDLIHCRSYMAALIGTEMKNKFGVKFIFDMRGFWADERVDGNLWNLKNPIYKTVYKFFKKKEKVFLSESDYSISLTEAGKIEIEKWGISNLSPIKIIPCCADLGHFSKENVNENRVNELRVKHGIRKDELVISYLGSIGTWYMLDEMLQFFSRVLLKYPSAKFLFITRDDFSNIFEKAKSYSIPKSQLIITPSTRNDVPNYLSLGNLNLFFIKPAFSKKSSSPTKQGEVMSMGIPIICNDNVGDTGAIIRDTNSGVVVSEFTTTAFDKIVLQIDSLLRLNPENGIKGAQKYYSLKNGIDKYLEVYQYCFSQK